MSITRSPFRPVPAIDPADWSDAVLVLAGHGSTRNGGANASLLRHAQSLRARNLFADVRMAALYGRPSARRALEGLEGRRVYVTPLFMCDGFFTRVALPRALGLSTPPVTRSNRDIVLCPPLGLQPALVPLVLERAADRAETCGLALGAASLLLIGHGSPRDPASRNAALWLAAGLRAAEVFGDVRVAFLDEPPTLGEALRALTGPTVAVGLFVAAGLHGGEDVPEAIARHAPVPVLDLGAIGEDPAIPDLVLDQVASACAVPEAQPLAV